MANNPRRCPYCGRVITERAQQAQEPVEPGRALRECDAVIGPVTRELYNCPAPNGERRCRHFCCDAGGCHTYGPNYRRHSFWPSFCRPRWLRCDRLYYRVR
ncbi:MAG: hypothetical protein FWH02_00255 [Oscillospiraceae bacterium]|nr:hypothetical protein [Oscillospiraceae bacterium]